MTRKTFLQTPAGRWVVAALGTAIATTMVVAFISTSQTDEESVKNARPTGSSSSPSPLDLPEPARVPLDDEAVSVDAAGSAVASVVSAGNEILSRADGGIEGLDAVASGFVWGELQSLATERQQLGYKQIGEATITKTSVKSVDLAGTPPSIVLDVCIDSTAVDLVDANGNSLKDLLYQTPGPVLNVYGAQYIDGTWKVATHSIPDNASCE